LADSASNRRGRAPKARAPSERDAESIPNSEPPDAGDELPVLLFVQERLRQVLADNERLTDNLESLRGRVALTDELSARITDLETELKGARADSNRLRAIAEKESVKRKMAEDALAEHRAPSRLPFGSRSFPGLQRKFEEARREASKRQEELSREVEARRALEAELRSTQERAAQSEAVLRSRIEESERHQAALEQQIEGVQEDLEARAEKAEVRELEVERRLEAVRSREAELVARQKELDLRDNELRASEARLQKERDELDKRQADLRTLAEEGAPRVIRLDDDEEANEASVTEMLAMLAHERRERRITEAELLRVRERASLLEHELSRLKGTEKGRRRR
jgi:hypothetical protein